MFDTLMVLFKKECALANINMVSSYLGNLLDLFIEEEMKDKNCKNAAIDAVIQILEKHKDTPAE